MKNLYLIDIQGSNIANVKYAFQNKFQIKYIKKPSDIIDPYPYVVLPGNGSFNHYVNFLNSTNWEGKFKEIIFNKKGKLLTICSGFQVLGKSSDESPNIKGLSLFDLKFKNIISIDNSSLEINIGRKEINEVNGNLSYLALDFTNKVAFNKIRFPYFIHGYAAELRDTKELNLHNCSYLYSLIGRRKILAGILSNNFCGTQFHPELSGSEWRKFMLEFFN